MRIAYLVVTIFLAAMAAFSGLGKLRHDAKIVHVIQEVVPIHDVGRDHRHQQHEEPVPVLSGGAEACPIPAGGELNRRVRRLECGRQACQRRHRWTIVQHALQLRHRLNGGRRLKTPATLGGSPSGESDHEDGTVERVDPHGV